jgi:hypothetical protein
MIYENNCLFLFNKDLASQYRNLDIQNINLKMFIKPGQQEDFEKALHASKATMYVDTNKRVIIYLDGPRAGRLDAY